MFENGGYIPSGKKWVAPTGVNADLETLAGRYNQNTQSQSSGNPLVDFFNSVVKPVGQAGASFFGSMGHTIGGLASGKNADEIKAMQDAHVANVYGEDNAKDAYAKNLGAAMKTAGTAASFIPGAGAIAGNVFGGAAQGFGDEFYEKGNQADLGTALGRAGTGAAAEGLTAGALKGVGKLAEKAGGKGITSILGSGATKLTDPTTILGNVGRGALSGAVGGGTSAVGNTLASGGSIEDALNNLGGGIGGGALAGGAMGGALGIGSKAINKMRGRTIRGVNGTTQATTEGVGKLNNKQVKAQRAIAKDITEQFGVVPKRVNDRVRPSETFTSVAGDFGLTNADDIRQGMNAMLDAGSKIIRDTAGGAGVVDLTDANRLVKELGMKNNSSIRKYSGLLSELIDETPSSISGNKSGVDALTLQRQIEKLANTADSAGTLERGGITYNADQLYKIASNIGDNLDSAVRGTGALGAALDNNAAQVQQLRDMFPNNKKWQARVDDMVNSVDSGTPMSSLRSSIKTPTRAMIFIDSADNNSTTYGGRTAGRTDIPLSKSEALKLAMREGQNLTPVRQARVDRNLNIVNGSDAAQMPKARSSAGSPFGDFKLGESGVVVSPGNMINANVRQSVARSQGQNAIANTANGQNALIDDGIADLISGFQSRGGDANDLSIPSQVSEQSANNILSALNSLPSQYTSGQTTTMATSPTYTLPNGQQVGLEDTEQAMMNAMMMGDTVAYDRLNEVYSMLKNTYERQAKSQSGASADLSAGDKTTLQNIQNSRNSLNQIADAFAKAGGGQGLAGVLTNTFGGLDENVRYYNDLRNSLGMAIIKNFVNLGATESDAKRYADMLPQFTDTSDSAQRKLATISDLLSGYEQSIYANY
ncbi:MAG: hypothetical protein ACK5MU_04020 [Candidatus Saccharimonadales bacterium]